MRRGLFLKVIVVFSFIVFLFVVIDVGLRAVMWATGRSMAMVQYVRRSTRPGLRWELNPEHEEVNSLGLRDRERSPVKRPGVVRVLCVGDSVTYGVGVPPGEACPAVLERLLSERLEPGRVEVFNAGVPGYSTDQELAYLRGPGLALHPDVVVVGFVLNDVITRFSGPMHWSHPVELFLRRHWALYYYLRATYLKVRKEISRKQEPLEVKARAMADERTASAMEETWRRVLGEQAKMEELTRRSGARFLLVIFPFKFQLAEPAEEAVAQRRILEFCSERGIPVLDLLPSLREPGRSAFLDSNHLSVAGNAAAAEVICNTLVDGGVLETRE